MADPDSWKKALAADPGSGVFVDYADYLRGHGDLDAAILVCIAGLSANPANERGRLVLARAFFERGFVPFAAREVAELAAKHSDNAAMKRLLARLNPDKVASAQSGASPGSPEQPVENDVIAETDFSFEELDLVERATKK